MKKSGNNNRYSCLIFFSQGHCFVAVNPNMFADGFEDRMQALMDQYRNLQPVCVTAINQISIYHTSE